MANRLCKSKISFSLCQQWISLLKDSDALFLYAFESMFIFMAIRWRNSPQLSLVPFCEMEWGGSFSLFYSGIFWFFLYTWVSDKAPEWIYVWYHRDFWIVYQIWIYIIILKPLPLVSSARLLRWTAGTRYDSNLLWNWIWEQHIEVKLYPTALLVRMIKERRTWTDKTSKAKYANPTSVSTAHRSRLKCNWEGFSSR